MNLTLEAITTIIDDGQEVKYVRGEGNLIVYGPNDEGHDQIADRVKLINPVDAGLLLGGFGGLVICGESPSLKIGDNPQEKAVTGQIISQIAPEFSIVIA